MATAEDIIDARRAVAARAAEAKEDPSSFFAFVHKRDSKDGDISFGEKKPGPLDYCVVPPHQRLVFDFVLAHKLCVLMLPAEHAKTSGTAMLGLYLLGKDPSLRGAIVSDAWAQSKKVLGMVKDYIDQPELYSRVRAVFPDLKPSERSGDPWTQSEIIVERPPGIRDPSLIAFGADGPIMGTRLDWALVDDLLTFENVLTKEGREKVIQWFFAGPVRACGRSGRLVVTNTPYHPEDLLHFLRDKKGWPTLRMDVYGNVWIYNTDFGTEGQPGADQLRDVDPKIDGPDAAPGACRLTGNDHEPPGRRTLWPDAADEARVEKDFKPNIRFAQLYATLTRDDETAVCKQEYVDRCYEEAKKVHAYDLTGGWHPERDGGITFTGIDLAFSKESKADFTAFVTFVVLPTGKKRILDVFTKRLSGPEVVKTIFAKFKAYDSILVVENNAAQDLVRQWALELDIALPIIGHRTGSAKANPDYGLPAIFTEMANGAWQFPCRPDGRVDPRLQKLVEGCLHYVPSAHTADELMALYVAWAEARKFGVPEERGKGGQSQAGSVMNR